MSLKYRKTLKPKEIKFNSWEELLKWEPGAREDDAINRWSVAPRFTSDRSFSQ